jgi:penicillin-binding protein A
VRRPSGGRWRGLANRGSPLRTRLGRSSRDLVAPRIGSSVMHVALAIGLVYLLIAGTLTYWQVVRADALTLDPANPLILAAQQSTLPGRILDARGTVLAKSVRLSNGTALRQYVHDASLGPLLGYRSSRYGTAGLEAAEDGVLIGLTGQSEADLLLRKLRFRLYQPQDVILGIDMRLQQDAERLMGNRPGAVVAMDPSTGRILALVSNPGFDPNTIANPLTAAAAFQRLDGDPNAPLLDRATQGLYVPGSVFKLVTSIAGLGSGTITAQTTYPDQPAEEKTGFLVDGYRVIDGHHPFTGNVALDYTQALEVSCNIYFAHVGLAVGGPAMVQWASRLGFGAPLPFVLPTAASQVTSSGGPLGGFKDRVELANAAYGQAEVLVTPLQMALVASTIANGGVLMRPQLVIGTRDAAGTLHPVAPAPWRNVVDAATASTIANAMEQAVSGTWGIPFAGLGKVPGVPTAGKTGTAQLGGSGEPHSWFVGFAPVQGARIAVAVLLERAGSGATQAAPLASEVMADYLALQPAAVP